MSESKFNWRGEISAVKSSDTDQNCDAKDGYELRKLWIPEGIHNLVIGADQWEPVRGIRFSGDDKAFLHGFTCILGLSAKQERQLLIMYADKYNEALSAARDSPYKHGAANRAANEWLRNGARGFLIRE